MMHNKITILYILGAGRSGTTLLTTLLDGSSSTFSTADLMQIYDYLCQNKICGDGVKIKDSAFWLEVLKNIPKNISDKAACITAENNYKIEHHKAILSNLCRAYNKDKINRYLAEQAELFTAISTVSGKSIIIDSSKYANRAFLLNMLNPNFDVKYIYNIRDVRGVINSFSKNVQSPRKPLSAILYYLLINIISQVIYWGLPKKNKIKIRYEDLMVNHPLVLDKISKLIKVPLDDIISKIDNNEDFIIGPVIEGNRLVQHKKLRIRYDNKWHTQIPRVKQIIYYLLAAPIMIFNRYKP